MYPVFPIAIFRQAQAMQIYSRHPARWVCAFVALAFVVPADGQVIEEGYPTKPVFPEEPASAPYLHEECGPFLDSAEFAEECAEESGGPGVVGVGAEQTGFSDVSLDAVPELRELARDAAASAGLDPASVLVGGDTAEQADSRTAGNRDSRVVLPLILLAIGVVLALLLRSLIAPLYLMATIAFTYFATLGLAVIVFLLVFDHAGIGPGVPFFLFVFLNALSVDYNIYLMSRIREEVRRAPLKEATGYALARTGPVITSAGLILAGTFSALMTLPLEDLVQLGFAVGIGVLIDTFITRTLIVPALVAIFGRWNWWPSRTPA